MSNFFKKSKKGLCGVLLGLGASIIPLSVADAALYLKIDKVIPYASIMESARNKAFDLSTDPSINVVASSPDGNFVLDDVLVDQIFKKYKEGIDLLLLNRHEEPVGMITFEDYGSKGTKIHEGLLDKKKINSRFMFSIVPLKDQFSSFMLKLNSDYESKIRSQRVDNVYHISIYDSKDSKLSANEKIDECVLAVVSDGKVRKNLVEGAQLRIDKADFGFYQGRYANQ